MNKILLTALTASAILITQSAQAEKWYHKNWVWGTGGVLAGIAIADGFHRHHHSGYYSNRTHDLRTYDEKRQIGPYYRQVDYATPRGGVYTKTVGVWPFYKRTTSIPVTLNERDPYASQTISAVEFHDILSSDQNEEADNTSEGDITINIGDNNENVSVTVESPKAEDAAEELKEVTTIPNTGDYTEGRVIDVKVANEDGN